MGGVEDWKIGLFSCMVNTNACLDAFLCAPCQASRMCLASQSPPQPQSFSLMYCIFATPPLPTLPIYSCMIRKRVVENYNIDESILCTAVKGIVFFPCSLCQSSNQLMLSNAWGGNSCFQSEGPMGQLPANYH